MFCRTCLSFLLMVPFLLSDASAKDAAHDSCDRRGCGHSCNSCDCGTVCKLVCTVKEIETVCYGCERGRVCIPGPSHRCQKCRQQACKCDCRSKLVWTEWIPGRAHVACRNTLKKYVVTKEVPSYKWVVFPNCRCDGEKDVIKSAPPGSELGDEFPAADDEIIPPTNPTS